MQIGRLPIGHWEADPSDTYIRFAKQLDGARGVVAALKQKTFKNKPAASTRNSDDAGAADEAAAELDSGLRRGDDEEGDAGTSSLENDLELI